LTYQHICFPIVAPMRYTN